MKKALLLPLFLLLFTAFSSASDIDGTWVGSFETPQGNMEITFEFTTDGTTLTGTSNAGMGATEFKNGTYNPEDESFSFDIEFQGMSIAHEGKLNDDDTITLTINIMDQENEMTLTKKK